MGFIQSCSGFNQRRHVIAEQDSSIVKFSIFNTHQDQA